MTTDPAVTAAAEALEAHYASGYFCRCGVEVNSVSTHMAAAAVAAARPIVEAEVRERIAAEIDAQFIGQDHHEPTFNSGRDAGLRLAARIARGQS